MYNHVSKKKLIKNYPHPKYIKQKNMCELVIISGVLYLKDWTNLDPDNLNYFELQLYNLKYLTYSVCSTFG